jgi:Uma2 family endonuclease
MAPPPDSPIRHTLAEYLELELQSKLRQAFYQGEIFEMAGTTNTQNLIVSNLRPGIRQKISAKPCRILAENVKLELLRDEYMIDPDIMYSLRSKRKAGFPG